MNTSKTRITVYLRRGPPGAEMSIECEASAHVFPGEVQDLEVRFDGHLVPLTEDETEVISGQLYEEAGADDEGDCMDAADHAYELARDEWEQADEDAHERAHGPEVSKW